MVFLDLKKAFDMVNHDILCKKLHKYGLRTRTVDCFKNHLGSRTQRTKVNGVLSDERTTVCGVPQGSILGPLLFIIYINDLSEYLDESSCSLYADDTAIYYSNVSYIEVALTLSIELEIVRQWLHANKLTLNVSKTKYMYLGLILDEGLNFEAHIDKLYNKTCSKVGVIKKVRNCLDNKLALTLYKRLVLPHIDYCDVVYMSATRESMNKLQLVRNKALRVILQAGPRDHITDMHRDLHLLMLEKRRELHLGLLCHKNVYLVGEQRLSRFFVRLQYDQVFRRTRNMDNTTLKVPQRKSASGRKAECYWGPAHWNSLNKDIRKVENFNSFRRLLMKKAFGDIDNHPT